MIIIPTQFYHIPNLPSMTVQHGKVTIDTTGYELPDMLTSMSADDDYEINESRECSPSPATELPDMMTDVLEDDESDGEE